MAWTSYDYPGKLFKHSNTRGQNKETKIHPTQKPIKLYQYCLSHFAKPGYKILDTHLGSGSSRIAAFQYGFDFVGFEINPDYFEAADNRFSLITSQRGGTKAGKV